MNGSPKMRDYYRMHMEEKRLQKQAKIEAIEVGSIKHIFHLLLKNLKKNIKKAWKLTKVTLKFVGEYIHIGFWLSGQLVEALWCVIKIGIYKLPESIKSKLKKGGMVLLTTLAIGMFLNGKIDFNKASEVEKAFNSSNTTQVATVEANSDYDINTSNDEKEIEIKINNNVRNATTLEAVTINAKTSNAPFFGEMGIKSEIGSVDASRIEKAVAICENSKTGEIEQVTLTEYGIGALTSNENKRYVMYFLNYLKDVDVEFYNEYFKDAKDPGTTIFDSAWYMASNCEGEKFKQLQFDYIYQNYVKPSVDEIKSLYNIDLLSTPAYRELIYSTANQYGTEGTKFLFEQAGITSKMSEKEVIKAIQEVKLNSLGKYTYTTKKGYNDAWRNGVKARIERELSLLLDMAN